MDSETSSSDIAYSEEIDELLLEKDKLIDDLMTRNKIYVALNEVLKDRIDHLKSIILSNFPTHLSLVIEYL